MYEQKEYIDIEEADITLSCIGKKSAPKHINNTRFYLQCSYTIVDIPFKNIIHLHSRGDSN